jgi:hypothetical protein
MHRSITFFALLCCISAFCRAGDIPLERRPGLLYETFGNTDLTRSFGTRHAPDLDAMDNANNDYGLRFTGFLAAPTDGEYAFRVQADTGVRLSLGGKTVIDGWARREAPRTPR